MKRCVSCEVSKKTVYIFFVWKEGFIFSQKKLYHNHFLASSEQNISREIPTRNVCITLPVI